MALGADTVYSIMIDLQPDHEGPVLALEVDGFHYHKEGTRQSERDRMKDEVFAKYDSPLLRFATNGSDEIREIKDRLCPSAAQ